MSQDDKWNFLRVAGLTPNKASPSKTHYATFNRRMMAATIDSFFIALIVAPLVDYAFNHMFGEVSLNLMELQQHAAEQGDPQAASIYFWHTLYTSGFLSRMLGNTLLQGIAFCAYSGICWKFWDATPGKMLVRIKVVDAETETPLSDGQILWRLWGYVVSAIGLLMGFFWIAFDKRRQGWHDKMADSVVVTVPWRKISTLPKFSSEDIAAKPPGRSF